MTHPIMWIRNRFRFHVTPGFMLLMAVALYLDREVGLLKWALLGCVVHELGHLGASLLLGGRPVRLDLTAVGAELTFSYGRFLSYGEETAVALSGPVSNLLLGVAAARIGGWILSALSLGIGIFNLLPVVPLDGGRVVSLALERWLPCPWPERIMMVLTGGLMGVLAGAGVIVAVTYANVTLLLTSIWILFGSFCGRGTAKKEVK